MRNRARIEVCDTDGRILARPRDAEAIHLPPGRYLVRSRLPSGAVAAKMIDVRAGDDIGEALTDPVRPKLIPQATLDALLPMQPCATSRERASPSTAEYDLLVVDSAGQLAPDHDIDQVDRDGFEGCSVDLRVAFRAPLKSSMFLYVRAPGCGQQCIALPVLDDRDQRDNGPACLVRIARLHDRIHLAATPATGFSSVLAAFLSRNAVLEAAAIGRRLNRERWGFEASTADGARPHQTAGAVAATLAGYAFIALGDLAELDAWPFAFADEVPEFADSAIVAGATAWLQGERATAAKWFATAIARGEPMFARGRALLIAGTRML